MEGVRDGRRVRTAGMGLVLAEWVGGVAYANLLAVGGLGALSPVRVERLKLVGW